MKTTFKDVQPLLYIGGGLLGLMLIRKILLETGLADKTADTPVTTPNVSNVPKDKNGTVCKHSYTAAQARVLMPRLANQIFYAKGTFKDDEPAVIDAFNQLRTRGDLYVLQGVFSGMHKQDLFSYIKTFLDKEDLRSVMIKVESLKCN